MAAFPFHCFHRVSYAECSVGNHVYYSKFLEIFERARAELFRAIGQPLARCQAEGLIFPASACSFRFRAPARYDDLLKVELALGPAQKVRLHFFCRIWNPAGALVAEGEVWHFAAELNERPRRIPEELAAALAPYVITPPPSLQPSA